jgi:hypothetical protein
VTIGNRCAFWHLFVSVLNRFGFVDLGYVVLASEFRSSLLFSVVQSVVHLTFAHYLARSVRIAQESKAGLI